MADTPQNPPVTLAIDIGGSGLKTMALDEAGAPLSERARVETPLKPTPGRVLEEIEKLKEKMPDFDRVSVGYPGVVKNGHTYTAANLHPEWIGYDLRTDLENRWGKPVRIANDAAVQGYGAITGKGVEMVLTLGTGMGSALYTEGHLCPGLELGHHPLRKGHTYEDYLGRAGLKKIGIKKWNRILKIAIDQTSHTFNWDHLYIGGGNAKLISFPLEKEISIVPNQDGLLGGVKLWMDDRH